MRLLPPPFHFEHLVAHGLIEICDSHFRVICLPFLLFYDALLGVLLGLHDFWQELIVEIFAGDEGHVYGLDLFAVNFLLVQLLHILVWLGRNSIVNSLVLAQCALGLRNESMRHRLIRKLR